MPSVHGAETTLIQVKLICWEHSTKTGTSRAGERF